MRIEALLEMVGLKAVASRPVGTYSKGMARRIGLAQALINDPDLLILDEPTTGLDPIGTRQIKDLIVEAGRAGQDHPAVQPPAGRRRGRLRPDRDSLRRQGPGARPRAGTFCRRRTRRQIVTDAISDATADRIREILKRGARRVRDHLPDGEAGNLLHQHGRRRRSSRPRRRAGRSAPRRSATSSRPGTARETFWTSWSRRSVSEKTQAEPVQDGKAAAARDGRAAAEQGPAQQADATGVESESRAASPAKTERVETCPRPPRSGEDQKEHLDELTGDKRPDGSTIDRPTIAGGRRPCVGSGPLRRIRSGRPCG